MSIDKQIRIAVRMKKEEKAEFLNLCKDLCINSSELIRTLIRKWVNDHKQ